MSYAYSPTSSSESVHRTAIDTPTSKDDGDGPDQTIPIAIVGMSLRFPGDAHDADSFWDMIMEGRCASKSFPADRLNGSSLYHPDPTRGESLPLHGGHFIEEKLGVFDAPFFSLSAAEATAMDPMSRTLLETTYRALENAGIPMDKVSNSNTSVYAGNLSNDYQSSMARDLEQGSKHGVVGMTSLLSGRLSWFFNLLGPCLTLDTACSSSLVALDLGCQTLYTGASDMSIVTGCSLLFSPDLFHLLSNMGMLSPDSKCFSFDNRANGYGRGEGVAALIIKRLPDAIRDGDTIRAVIRSVGTNQDGHTPGVTQPSKTAQTSLIRDTYSKAGLDLQPTRYFEAHGTGTPVGDPIEAYAIGNAFRNFRTTEDPLYIGSVKSNIGHLEGASGLAAVIKSILVLETGIIPPNTNFERINPAIDAVGLNLKIPVVPTLWPVEGLRRVSVNSFGASGTNAHAILDDAYHYLLLRGLEGNHCTFEGKPIANTDRSKFLLSGQNGNAHPQAASSHGLNDNVRNLMNTSRLLLLSASDKMALKRMIHSLDEWLEKNRAVTTSSSFLDNLVYTLTERRSFLPHRSFVVLDPELSVLDLSEQMSAPIRATKQPKVAFIFTGQGAQWAGMGRELLKFPVFLNSVLDSQEFLSRIGCSWNVVAALCDTEDKVSINRPSLSQTLCTVLQVAIGDLYEDLNLVPSAVVGHSSGEIAAAYMTGAISKHSALKLAYYRGVISEKLTQKAEGGMMAVGISAAEMEPLLVEVSETCSRKPLTIACINSPLSVTISGDRPQLATLATALEKRNIFHRYLHVDLAYHSPYMEVVAAEYLEQIQSLEYGDCNRRAIMISSVTGDAINGVALNRPEYWVDNMLKPVLFSAAIKRLCFPPGSALRKRLDGSHRNYIVVNSLVEIGPHAALQGPIRDTIKSYSPSSTIGYFSAMKRASPSDKTFLSVLGQMACRGVDINFALTNKLARHEIISNQEPLVLPNLPEYPFDHSQNYWPTGRLEKEFRFRRHKKLDLLGQPAIDFNPLEPRWTNFIKSNNLPWAADHKINGAVIYPAVGMLVMAIEAANQLADHTRHIEGFTISDTYFLTALVIPTSAAGIETQLRLRPVDSSDRNTSSWDFVLYSCEDSQWHENSHGRIQVGYVSGDIDFNEGLEKKEFLSNSQHAHRAAQNAARWTRSKDEFYTSAFRSGYTFGPLFRVMDTIAFSDDHGLQTTADVECFDWHANEGTNHFQEHVIHPVTLDGLMQTSLAVFSRAGEDVMATAVPTEIEKLWISASGLSFPQTRSIKSRAQLVQSGNVGYETMVTALDTSLERVLVHAQGVKLRFVTGGSSSENQLNESKLCYNLQWKVDIDLLGGIRSFQGEPPFNGSITEPYGSRDILEIASLTVFKNPAMKIGHFTGQLNTGDVLLLDNFFMPDNLNRESLPYETYSIFTSSDTTLDKLEKSHERFDGLSIQSWKFVDKQPSGTISNESLHLVFAALSVISSKNVLEQIYKSLKYGGRLIAFDDSPARGLEERLPLQNLDGTTLPDCSSALPLSDNINSENFNRTVIANAQELGFSEPRSPLGTADIDSLVLMSVKLWPPPVSTVVSHYVLVVKSSSAYQHQLATTLQERLQNKPGVTCELRWFDTDTITDSGLIYVFLLELEDSILETISAEQFSLLQGMLVSANRLIWLTAQHESSVIHPSRAMMDGLARVLRVENDAAVIVTASIERASFEKQAESITTIIGQTNFNSNNNDYEQAYVQRNGIFEIARVKPSKTLSQQASENAREYQSKVQPFGAGPPLEMTMATPGLLDSLHFVEDCSVSEALAPDEVEIQVQMVGLNFKDLLLALGRINGTSLGNECSGIITRAGQNTTHKIGDRVCVLVPTAFRTYTRAKGNAVARIPDSISLADAASIPTQFITAYYAINSMAKLEKGESILIHSGAGGTGQAAIQIAQYLGAEIYTTVSSEEKKRFLKSEYSIPEDHVFYSRDTSFADGISRMTNGRGIDVIINSLAGDSLIASWNSIAPYGRFIEIGRKDLDANSNLPMRPFLRSATFAALETSKLSIDNPARVREACDQILQMFVDGTLHPVRPFRIMPISDVQKGMRMLQEGKNMGKIVFEMTPEALVPTVLRTRSPTLFDEKKTYVIAGGTGGLGLAIAKWMVEERGAKRLLLLSRSGEDNLDAARTIGKLRERGVSVEAPKCDITDASTLSRVLEKYSKSLPPIGGCIQASMVLRDKIFEKMSYDEWRTSTDPKTLGSWNLHELLPRGISFFILLSSVAGIVGSPGQANYAAGNTYMDALARFRVAQGERATAIDLGVMLENGVLASNDALRERILAAGYLSGISPSEFFGLLDIYCDPQRDIGSQDDSQVVMGLTPPARLRSKAAQDPTSFIALPFFRHLLADGASRNDSQDAGIDQSIAKSRQLFVAADDVMEAGAIVSKALIKRLLTSLAGAQDVPEADEDLINKPIHHFGVDSLMAIELRSWFAKEFGADVPIFEILGEGTLLTVGISAASKSTLRKIEA